MVTSIIPTYISAISSVISLCITAYSVRNLVKNNKQIQKEKTEHHARSVSAWLTEERGESQVIIQNNSNTPIYDVFIIAISITGAATRDGEEAMKINNDYRENYFKEEHHNSDYAPIYPYLVFQKVPPGRFLKDLGFLDGTMHRFFGVEYAFTDSYGNAWKVDYRGQLSKLKDNYLYTKYALDNPTSWAYLDYFKDSIEKNIPEK
jgi:hypothetical protein